MKCPKSELFPTNYWVIGWVKSGKAIWMKLCCLQCKQFQLVDSVQFGQVRWAVFSDAVEIFSLTDWGWSCCYRPSFQIILMVEYRNVYRGRIFCCVCDCLISVQAGGGVHGVQETTSRLASKNHRLLRASIPRQNVRRKKNPRGGQRVPQRGLTLRYFVSLFLTRGDATVYCPSVCPSVRFRYRDHICWKTSKINSPPNSDVEILAQSSADFVFTYNFQGIHILGASRGHLCDSVASWYLFEWFLMEFWGRMHNTVVTATSKLKSIYDGVVFTSVCMTPSSLWKFTSKLSLVGRSACRKSVVAVLENVNIAHVRTQRDQIPFFDDV